MQTVRTIWIWLLCCSPAAANKFQTIGGGVAGSSADKIVLLKTIGLIAGALLLIAGTGVALARRRLDAPMAAGPVIMLLGALCTLPWFF